MKRNIDLTENNIFSNHWNVGEFDRLYKSFSCKCPHRSLPWEKSNEELATAKNSSVITTTTITTTTTINRWINTLRRTDDITSTYDITQWREWTRFFTIPISTVYESTVDDLSWIRSWSLSSDKLYKTVSFKTDDTDVYKLYEREDDDLFFTGTVFSIRKRRRGYELNRMHFSSKSEKRKPWNDHDIVYKDPKPYKYKRWVMNKHGMSKSLKNICGWMYGKGEISYNGDIPPSQEHFPKRFNEIKEYYDAYEDLFNVNQSLVDINGRRILLPRNVVKYKGKDFGTERQKEPWMPNGRVRQKYDRIFDKSEEWEHNIAQEIMKLPTAL